MIKITFAEKNNLIVKYQDGKSFYRDLELFKKHFQGHSLNTELAMANQFSVERLDGQMLHILLDEVDIKDILDNRAEKQPQAPKEQTEVTVTSQVTSETVKAKITSTPEAKAEQTATTETTDTKTTDTNKKKGQKTKSSPK